MKQFKDILKDKRLQLGLTQKQLAEKLGVFYTSIANYERGTVVPSYLTVWDLADVFDCSIDELVGRNR